MQRTPEEYVKATGKSLSWTEGSVHYTASPISASGVSVSELFAQSGPSALNRLVRVGDLPAPITNPEAWPVGYADGFNNYASFVAQTASTTPPAGARDAVYDQALELLDTIAMGIAAERARNKTDLCVGLIHAGNAVSELRGVVATLTGKADGWEAMTKAAMDLKMRHVDNHQGDIYHALQSLIVKFGKPWDGKLTEATQPAAPYKLTADDLEIV